MKNVIKTITKLLILTILVTTGFAIGGSKSTFAEVTGEKYIKDVNGEDMVTGNRYYIAPEFDKRRALTFEVYSNWDYVLISNERKNDIKTHGTPVEVYIKGTNEKKGIKITQKDKIILKMIDHNYAGHKYFNFNGTGGYVWLDDKSDEKGLFLEQEDYKSGIALNTGEKNTIYYDSFGRVTGKLLSAYSRDFEYYVYAYNFNPQVSWANPGKVWLNVQRRLSWKFRDQILYGEIPKFTFTKVNK